MSKSTTLEDLKGKTPAEQRELKQQAAHDNQVEAERELGENSPQSDAAQGEVGAPVKSPKGTSYPKESRKGENGVGTVEYYSAGTAGDQANPERVYESNLPTDKPNADVAPDTKVDEVGKSAKQAADETRVPVSGENPYGQADKKEAGNKKEAEAKSKNTGAARTPGQADNRGGAGNSKTSGGQKPAGQKSGGSQGGQSGGSSQSSGGSQPAGQSGQGASGTSGNSGGNQQPAGQNR